MNKKAEFGARRKESKLFIVHPRFRSIAKSYFRRADGVLLLYDCTYERSFLNIREWMDSIEVCFANAQYINQAAGRYQVRFRTASFQFYCPSKEINYRLNLFNH